ncbi:MAG: 4Fe-4S binding protein [Deltaproteobacteria bacterium]|nr:4Fe-4S binding protein [Deltaproteobacteria bacterium]
MIRDHSYRHTRDSRAIPDADYGKCTKCGRCLVCNYGAMTIENKTPRIDLTLCERCGVCESLCPVDAIMIQRPA